MKSLVYNLTAPRKVEIISEEIKQETDDSEQIIVETIFSAISPGTELAAYLGKPPLRPTKKIYPRLLGYCNVSRIIHLGESVNDYDIGDVILTHLPHCSHGKINSHEILCQIPVDANYKEAAITYLFHLGYMACMRANVIAGKRVAIVGMGTLGLTSSAMTSLCGANVTGFTSHHHQKKTLDAFGIKKIVTKSTVPKIEFDSYDVVITTSNLWEDWELALKLCRPGGEISVIGFPGRGQTLPNFNPLASEYFYDKQLSLYACGYVSDVDVHEQDIRFTLKRNCQFLLESILSGDLPASELIAETRSWEDLPLIYHEMSSKRKSGKTIILDWEK